jgi:histone H1/5
MSSYTEKVLNAITTLKERSGSSLPAIKKFLSATKAQFKYINAALKRGVQEGSIVKNGGKFKATKTTKTTKAKKTKKKTTAKKKAKAKATAVSVKPEPSSSLNHETQEEAEPKKTVNKKTNKKTKSATNKKTKTASKTKVKAEKALAKAAIKADKALAKEAKKNAKAQDKAAKALVKANQRALKASRRPLLKIKVAGVSFKKPGIKKCIRKHGEVFAENRFCGSHRVQLKREPNNPYDSYAIAVVISGNVIGYIPRSMNRSLSVKETYEVWSLRFVPFVGEYTCTIAMMPSSYKV